MERPRILGLDLDTLCVVILCFNAGIAWRDDDWSSFLSWPTIAFAVLGLATHFVDRAPRLRRRFSLP